MVYGNKEIALDNEDNWFFQHLKEYLDTYLKEKTIEEVNADRTVSNNNKNRQIVISLYEKGIFDIKDAINLVADRLAISRHTVYLYIRQIKQEQE